MTIEYDVSGRFVIYGIYYIEVCSFWAFPGTSDDKESASGAGDLSLIPVSGKSPGEWNGYSLQYSRPENSMDRGAWQATVHGVTKSWT